MLSYLNVRIVKLLSCSRVIYNNRIVLHTCTLTTWGKGVVWYVYKPLKLKQWHDKVQSKTEGKWIAIDYIFMYC